MPTGEIVFAEMPVFKTPYNHDTNFESDRTALYCADPSLTKQEFKEETDINTILKRFTKTGELPPAPLPEHFTDVSRRTSYFEMRCQIQEAEAIFYNLSADKRAEHLNNPERWADAVTKAVDAGDRDALLKLGIDVPPAPPTEPPEPKTTPTPTGGTPTPVPASGASDAPKTAPSGASN